MALPNHVIASCKGPISSLSSKASRLHTWFLVHVRIKKLTFCLHILLISGSKLDQRTKENDKWSELKDTFKGALLCYIFVSHSKATCKRCLHISGSPPKWSAFCCQRLCYCSETICCHLLLWMARIGMDWDLKCGEFLSNWGNIQGHENQYTHYKSSIKVIPLFCIAHPYCVRCFAPLARARSACTSRV